MRKIKSPLAFVELSLCAMHLAAYIEYMGRSYHTNNERIIRLTIPENCRDCQKVGNEAMWKVYREWRDAKPEVASSK